MIRYRLLSASLAAAAVMAAAPLHAGDLPAPKGAVILTVSGAIRNTNGAGIARFDMAMLEALPQHSFTTTTIWTEGANLYSGATLADVLTLVGATGKVVQASALNDYRASLDAADVTPDVPLLAYRVDGATIPVREKGPIWLIFPFDSDPAFRTETIYARAVWQLTRIEVLE